MNWKVSFFAFVCLIAGTCLIPFATDNGKTKTEEPVPVVVVQEDYRVSETNNFTNVLNRANGPNTGWFSDSSTYIWDGWKIK